MQNSSGISRGGQGFTIVELLIVVVVVAILAAITVVSYNGISSRAKTATVESSVADLKKKVELYRVGSDGQYPTYADLIAGGAAPEVQLGALDSKVTRKGWWNFYATADEPLVVVTEACDSPRRGFAMAYYDFVANSAVDVTIGNCYPPASPAE